MEVRTKHLGHGVCFVWVSGSVDMETAATFRTALRAMVDAQPTGIILSVADVSYMDSAGLAVLVELVRWSREGRITLVLSAAPPAVCHAVELGQLTEVFEFVANDSAALARFELPADAMSATVALSEPTP